MVGDARGWMRLGPDPAIAAWADAARPIALRVLAESDEAWRCGGTWFAGVDALPNGPRGEIGAVPLPDGLLAHLPVRPAHWHHAQVSTLRPGYPRPWAGEGDAAYRYRQTRDAAHVDGLLPIGADRRRMLREPHAFILGLPLTRASVGAAPLVVWEGSHEIIRSALSAVLSHHSPGDWPDVDITDAYHAARREVFASCRRVCLPAGPGEAVLLHRLVLHGMAPWAEGATADPAGRAIAYFRPMLSEWADWLGSP